MLTGQPNTKFAMLLLRDCSTAIHAPADMGEGVSVHSGCPIGLPDQWQRWLGELRTAWFAEANLVIGIEQASQTPTILDAEMRALDARLTRVWHGLLLQSIPSYKRSLFVLGGVN